MEILGFVFILLVVVGLIVFIRWWFIERAQETASQPEEQQTQPSASSGAKEEPEIAQKQEFSESQIASKNDQGDKLEKEGKEEQAIAVYKELTNSNVRSPFPYKRLAILYLKKGETQNEIGVLNRALQSIDKNDHHYQWFQDRLSKVQGQKK